MTSLVPPYRVSKTAAISLVVRVSSGDIRLPGMREAAIVRSSMAHARITGIVPPEGVEPGQFWTARDLAGHVRPLVVSPLRGTDVG